MAENPQFTTVQRRSMLSDLDDEHETDGAGRFGVLGCVLHQSILMLVFHHHANISFSSTHRHFLSLPITLDWASFSIFLTISLCYIYIYFQTHAPTLTTALTSLASNPVTCLCKSDCVELQVWLQGDKMYGITEGQMRHRRKWGIEPEGGLRSGHSD